MLLRNKHISFIALIVIIIILSIQLPIASGTDLSRPLAAAHETNEQITIAKYLYTDSLAAISNREQRSSLYASSSGKIHGFIHAEFIFIISVFAYILKIPVLYIDHRRRIFKTISLYFNGSKYKGYLPAYTLI